MAIRLIPIDFKADGSPMDEKLFSAAQRYSVKEFGEESNFRWYSRCWVVLSVKEDDAEYFEVVGLLGARNVVDFPLFHVTPRTQDKEGLAEVHAARNAMIERGKSFCADALYLQATEVFVYVSEKTERYWRGFLKRIKAKPANRYQVKI